VVFHRADRAKSRSTAAIVVIVVLVAVVVVVVVVMAVPPCGEILDLYRITSWQLVIICDCY